MQKEILIDVFQEKQLFLNVLSRLISESGS
jgi:hypothetical protein